MSATDLSGSDLAVAVDERTLEIVERRRERPQVRGRGWLMRRMLLAADVIGLLLAFFIAEVTTGAGRGFDELAEWAIFLAMLPAWIVGAKLYGLYNQDEERTDHSTADDLFGVFNLTTVGAFVLARVALYSGVAHPQVTRLTVFWFCAIVLVSLARVTARAYCRRRLAYLQNAVIVGAGDVGQLIARKLLQHPEYGINLVGFVDERPKERREDLAHLTILGSPSRLPEIVELLDVERVIFAFSGLAQPEELELARALREQDVQIDIVPRLYEVIGPSVTVHTVEGLPLFALPPARIGRSSRLLKRALDIAITSALLALTSPFFAYAALRIKLGSPGPALFRQRRLGMAMNEFDVLKFRTMKVGTSESEHRSYIEQIMSRDAVPNGNGIYKLDRADVVTPFGRWLRKTSLDELPQLINVLRGDMSLVGPRPCLRYETEHFARHHFERFLVPAGMTGLWQVTARAHSTFVEALDLDVAYARGWSLGLDLSLLFKTPLQLVRARGTA